MAAHRGLGSFLFAASIAACTLLLVVCLFHPASAQGISFGSRQPGASASSAGIFEWIFTQQAAFYRSLSNAIRASKTNGSAVWGLLGISFLYGIFHAAGPGHGKAVISAYVVANDETWKRGVILSFASAALQSIVAIAIVAVGSLLLGTTARAMGSTVHVIEIVSYALIVLVGLRLLWVKGQSFIRSFRETRPRSLGAAAASAGAGRSHHHDHAHAGHHGHGHEDHHHAHRHHDHDHCDHDHASAWGHSHAPEPAELEGPGGWRKGLTAIVAVGVRPCSGAIIVLVFALAQNLFWTGVGATLLMGLGTAITVAAIATIAVGARSLAGRIAASRPGFGTLAIKGIEVGAAAVLVVLGSLLLTGYLASEQLRTFGA